MRKFRKKHYDVLAKFLRSRVQNVREHRAPSEFVGSAREMSRVVDELSEFLRKDSKKFDPEKFKEAIWTDLILIKTQKMKNEI